MRSITFILMCTICQLSFSQHTISVQYNRRSEGNPESHFTRYSANALNIYNLCTIEYSKTISRKARFYGGLTFSPVSKSADYYVAYSNEVYKGDEFFLYQYHISFSQWDLHAGLQRCFSWQNKLFKKATSDISLGVQFNALMTTNYKEVTSGDYGVSYLDGNLSHSQSYKAKNQLFDPPAFNMGLGIQLQYRLVFDKLFVQIGGGLSVCNSERLAKAGYQFEHQLMLMAESKLGVGYVFSKKKKSK